MASIRTTDPVLVKMHTFTEVTRVKLLLAGCHLQQLPVQVHRLSCSSATTPTIGTTSAGTLLCLLNIQMLPHKLLPHGVAPLLSAQRLLGTWCMGCCHTDNTSGGFCELPMAIKHKQSTFSIQKISCKHSSLLTHPCNEQNGCHSASTPLLLIRA